MADLFINVDFSSVPSQEHTRKVSRNRKQFLRRRRFLEQRGLPNRHRLPNQKAEQSVYLLDHNKQNGQSDSKRDGHGKAGGLHNNTFHQRGKSDTSFRTAGAVSTSINCAPNRTHPAAKSHHSVEEGAKKTAKPLHQQHNPLSEYESGFSPAASVSSYKMVAIDCEMVGTGLNGRDSALARCSVVNYQGDVMYDNYIKPTRPVTDYRTRWSGIQRKHLVNAVPFSMAQKEILKMLHGKIVIGHAIHNDYKALGYFHPKEMTRDTSKIPLLNRKAGFPETETVSLKRFAKQVLHKDIQTGSKGHSSVEDAKTTMELYRTVEVEYERELAAGKVQQ